MAFGTKMNISKVLFILLFLSTSMLFSADFTSTGVTSDWNTGSTWDVGTPPTSTDNVIINHAVTLASSNSITNVTVNSGGSLSGSVSNVLTIAGNVIVNSGASFPGNASVTFNSGGTQTLSGSFSDFMQFSNLVISGSGTVLDNNLSSSLVTIVVNGQMTISGTSLLNAGNSTYNLNYQSLSGDMFIISSTATSPLVPENSTFLVNTNQTLNINSSGGSTIDFNNFTHQPVSGTAQINFTGSYTIDGTLTLADASTGFSGGTFSYISGSLVYSTNRTMTAGPEWPAADAQLDNITISGATTLSLNETKTVDNLTVSSGTLEFAGFDLNVNSGSSLTVSGGTVLADAEQININGGLNLSSGTLDVNDLNINSNATFTKGGGTLTLGVAGIAYASGSTLIYSSAQTAGDEWAATVPNVTINSGTISISGSSGRTVSNALTVNSTLSAGSNELIVGDGSGTDLIVNGTLNTIANITTTSNASLGNSATLDLSAADLSVNSLTLSFLSSVTTSGTVSATGDISVSGGATVGIATNGTLLINGTGAQNLSGTLTVFNLEVNNSGTSNITTNSTFQVNTNGKVLVTDGTFVLASNARFLDASGNTPDSGDNLQLEVAANGVLESGGVDLTKFNSYNLSASGATIRFTGSNTETIPATTYSNLTVNNSNSTGPNTGGVLTINGTLTLTDGVINNSNRIDLADGASVSGGSDASYINGIVAHSGTTGDKIFPVGKSGSYRPITLLGVSGTNPKIQFELKESAGGTPGTGINNLSIFRYWQGSLLSGSLTDAQVRLSYGSDDGVDGDPANLRVAKSTSYLGIFNSIGNTAAGGGSVTSASNGATIQFYRIGDAIGDNSLPVEMASFEATPDFDKVTINWKTASEVENLGFNIFRKSANDESWSQVNDVIISGRGNYSGETNYEFVDNAVVAGQTYEYKLESISINGVINVEKTVELQIPVPTEYVLFKNYPNPFNPTTNLKFQLPEYSKVTISVYDISGRLVKTLLDNANYNAGQHVVSWDATNQDGIKVSSGMYFYRFNAGSFNQLGRMILLK